jgi:hypothetical protein
MFILDSLLVSGLRWVLDTVKTAADAEADDDTALREALMAAEMRRELGEISDEEFAATEADLLARIRAIKERRDGGAGPIAFGGGASEGEALEVEATVAGDFHERPFPGDGGTAIESAPVETSPPRRPARRYRPVAKPRRISRKP